MGAVGPPARASPAPYAGPVGPAGPVRPARGTSCASRAGRRGPRCRRWSPASSSTAVRRSSASRCVAAAARPPALGLAEQAGDLLVDDPLRRLGVGPARTPARSPRYIGARSRVADRPERVRSCRTRGPSASPARWPRTGRWRRRSSLAEHDQLGRPSAEAHRQRVLQISLGVQVPLVVGELLGDAERLAGGQDRHLRHRVGVLGTTRRRARGPTRAPPPSTSPRAAARSSRPAGRAGRGPGPRRSRRR